MTRKDQERRITRSFRIVNRFVGHRFPEFYEVGLYIGCPMAEEQHRADPRGYMHTHCRPETICSSWAAGELSMANLLGLFLHEFGHLIGGNEQADADIAILESFGLPILYDRRGVQYIEV